MKTDQQIKDEVMEQIRWEPLLHAASITVSVQNGEVTLTGNADNYAEKFTAQRAAFRVKDIKSITNNILVALPGKYKPSDEAILKNILETLAWHSSIPENSIQVTVDKGCVSLNGELPFKYMAETAFNAILHLPGIILIQNNILIGSGRRKHT
ncbi:BON domain-containing protein [Mucilaginibacter sp. BJC16-A38]|uniref:BON domain-containing protein n=1 Tax=Mucilaginibacter phenanthrenivorans TaxID=1234842 RepID=UPI0021588E15|nr:BON domain-containing protein [Mucilaginibacter phenanthrenivorans]MCR8560789.1 BON domain-containing protein [Mucilaginibacter phenanthrenivorans]